MNSNWYSCYYHDYGYEDFECTCLEVLAIMAKEYKTLQELFADEDRWTKNFYALDAEGNSVDAKHPDATCWCIIGGVIKVYGDYDKPETKEVFAKIKKYINSNTGLQVVSVDNWNDSPMRTIKDIQKLSKECNI